MPAVPLALAEIEERLEEIRYLLNRRSLFTVLAPALGVLLGLAAALVWSAAGATPAIFAAALAASVAVALLALGWAALVLWRRWLSLEEVALLADERAGLKQRLATVLWLSRSGAQPSMAPVLVADTIGKRESWQAAAIVPRRLPLELAYPIAGAIALLVAFLLAPRLSAPPEPVAMKMKPPPHPIEKREPEPPREPPRAQRPEEGAQPLLMPHDDRDQPAGEPGDAAGSKGSGGMSEQLRGAIRQALARGGQMDRPREIGRKAVGRGEADVDGSNPLALGQPRGTGAGEKKGDGETGARPEGSDGKGRESEPEAGAEGKGGQASAKDAAGGQKRGGEKGSGEPKGGKPHDGESGAEAKPKKDSPGGEAGEQRQPSDVASSIQPQNPVIQSNPPRGVGKDAKGKPIDGQGTQPGGAHPVAGPGADPNGLFAGGDPSAQNRVTRAPDGSFKLTLGSFLGDTGGKRDKPESNEKVPALAERAPSSDPPSLNPNQTGDDALRRADVPPEYEEIVRRIYSARPAN